jgi:hypothetical protein
MRKHILALVTSLVALVISAPSWATNDGVVLGATGQTSAKGADGATRKLDRRSPISAGDTILTGADGKVQLRMKDGTVLALGENSEFAIKHYTTKASGDKQDGAALKLVKGTLMQVSGNMEKSAYTLETPVSTLGIRGTVFNIQINTDGSVTATVADGAVATAASEAVAGAQQAVATAQTAFNAAVTAVNVKKARLAQLKADPDADPAAIAALESEITDAQDAADTAATALNTANADLQTAVEANGQTAGAGQALNTGTNGQTSSTTPVTFTAATPAELAGKVAADDPASAAEFVAQLILAYPDQADAITDAAVDAAPGQADAIREAAQQAEADALGATPPPGSNDPSQQNNLTEQNQTQDSVSGTDTPENPVSAP